MTDLDSLKYTAEHEWIALDGAVPEPVEGSTDAGPETTGTVIATVGITDYAADKLGDVVFVDLPSVDSGVTAGQVCGEIESTKSVGELYAPLTGDVIAVNDAVVDDPSLVNSDPYGDGWLVKLRVDASAVADLLDRDAYVAQTGGAE